MGIAFRAMRQAALGTALVALALTLTACSGKLQTSGQKEADARSEKDKTPYPCKEKYSDAEVASWVEQHLTGAKGGHEEPQLLLLLGGSGAGKGTFIGSWQEVERAAPAESHPLSGFIFHGLDEYLPYIPEYQLSVGDKAFVYKDAADACYSPAAIPAAKLAGNKIIEGKMDLIYEETGKSLDRILKRVLPPYTKAGYRVTTVLVHNKAETAIARSAGRFVKTGRYAPDDYINGTFKNNLETYQELKKVDGLAEFVYCDNSGSAIQCWQDSVTGGPLVPKGVLQEGKPVLMGTKPQPKPAAGKGREPEPKPAAGKGREAEAKPAAGKGREAAPKPAAGKGRADKPEL